MQISSAPSKISVPFAASGDKQSIPVASQIGIAAGRASYTDGFPPLTRTPIVAGGIPPFGTDMNGILNAITAVLQYQNAGGHPQYDSAFSTSVGGYPKYAILQKADGTGLWISTADNNINNPDTGGANWVDLIQGAAYGLDSGAANAYAVTFAPALTALRDGMVLRFKAANANSGASTFNPNGLGAKPIVGGAHSALQGGEIVANGDVWLQYNSSIGAGSWVMVDSTGGAMQTAPATQSQHAMQLGQAIGRLIGVRVFTSSGTYTPTTGTNSVVVELIGGGGAGGGCVVTNSSQISTGTAGCSGSYGKGRFTSGFSGVTVTVGAAGTGSSAGPGGNGGTSSFGALLSATGGNGGSVLGPTVAPFTANTNNGGSSVSGANIMGAVSQIPSMAYVSTLSVGISGAGAHGLMGSGGQALNGSGAGMPANNYGAGGGGALALASSGAQAGGAGSPGIVIIYEYA